MLKREKIEKILIKREAAVIQNGAICFLPGDRSPEASAGNSFLGRIQDTIKKYGTIYYLLKYIFAPVLNNYEYEKIFKSLIKKNGKDKVIVNLGSGPSYPFNRRDIINVDIFAFNEVDIVADASDLPIESESVDLVINSAMLEHVPDPEKVVHEMNRILRKEGEVFCYLPFIVPFHAAPNDFYRWTKRGATELFKNFDNLQVGMGAGPTSGMLWVFQEWLAVLLSFGSKSVHDLVFMILMVITAPIKLIDLVLVKFPYAGKIASGFYVKAERR